MLRNSGIVEYIFFGPIASYLAVEYFRCCKQSFVYYSKASVRTEARQQLINSDEEQQGCDCRCTRPPDWLCCRKVNSFGTYAMHYTHTIQITEEIIKAQYTLLQGLLPFSSRLPTYKGGLILSKEAWLTLQDNQVLEPEKGSGSQLEAFE